MTGPREYADRERPSWSEPLAPLADWLKSVDTLIDDSRTRRRRSSRHYPSVDPHPYRSPIANHRRLSPSWLTRWRKRLDLTPAKAAHLLGYANGKEILQIEHGLYVKRNPERQMRLVMRRVPEAARNRSRWLHNWRRRMGFTCARATEVLGYYGRCNLYRVEHGPSRPSWEKILITIAEEQLAAGNDACQRTTPSDTRAILPSLGA